MRPMGLLFGLYFLGCRGSECFSHCVNILYVNNNSNNVYSNTFIFQTFVNTRIVQDIE